MKRQIKGNWGWQDCCPLCGNVNIDVNTCGMCGFKWKKGYLYWSNNESSIADWSDGKYIDIKKMTLRDKLSETIWNELNDEAWFIETDKLNKCSDKLLSMFIKEALQILNKKQEDVADRDFDYGMRWAIKLIKEMGEYEKKY